jgi:hypothetical protein
MTPTITDPVVWDLVANTVAKIEERGGSVVTPALIRMALSGVSGEDTRVSQASCDAAEAALFQMYLKAAHPPRA